MSKAIILISLIVAIAVTYPFVANISTVSEIGSAYVLKWSEIPLPVRANVYESAMKLSEKTNTILKILLELAGIFVFILTIIEYYKYHKIYKEEM